MKPQLAFVLRSALGDSSNGGVTSREESVYLFPKGTPKNIVENWVRRNVEPACGIELPENMDDVANPNVKFKIKRLKDRCFVLERNHTGYTSAKAVFKKDGGIYAFGGNYIDGDSNFKQMVGHSYPIAVFDRFETWAEYEALSV